MSNQTSFKEVADTLKLFKWRCDGKFSGKSVDCQSNKLIDSRCTKYEKAVLDEPPSSTYIVCDVGEKVDVADMDTKLKWNCVGEFGGATVNCSAAKMPTTPTITYPAPECFEKSLQCEVGVVAAFSETIRGNFAYYRWYCVSGDQEVACNRNCKAGC